MIKDTVQIRRVREGPVQPGAAHVWPRVVQKPPCSLALTPGSPPLGHDAPLPSMMVVARGVATEATWTLMEVAPPRKSLPRLKSLAGISRMVLPYILMALYSYGLYSYGPVL